MAEKQQPAIDADGRLRYWLPEVQATSWQTPTSAHASTSPDQSLDQ